MGKGGKVAILFIFAILFSFATASNTQIVFAEHNPNHNPNENSNKVLTGAGPPPDKLGNIDDFYIDSSGEFATYYVKTAQGWQGPLELRGGQGPQGEQGEQGPQGEQGEQGPQGEQGEQGHNSLTVVTNEPAGQNCEEGGIKIESGVDDDNDGVLDIEEIDFTGFVCKMTGPEGPEGPQGPPPVADTLDTDGDGIPNATDPDDDNDGVDDISDVAPFNRTICSDTDHDWCDDCSSGQFDPNNDGIDTDQDSICNVGDPDDDNDGIPDVFDPSPVDPVGACEIGQLLKWTGTGWSCADDNVDDADSDPTNEIQDIPSSGISCENQLAIAAAIQGFTPDTVCLEGQVCGDGIVSGTETCDDGNNVGGDGCTSSCQIELACENGVFDESTQSCVCDEGFFGELCNLESPGPGGACSLDEASTLEACVNNCFEGPEDDLTCSQNCLSLVSPACQQATTTLLLCGFSEGCLDAGSTFEELTSCSQLACPAEFIDVFGALECQNGVYDSFTESCFCDDGFGGILCQTQALACENGTFDFGLERCVCVDGFTGELCEVPVPDDGTPCNDGNVCTIDDVIIDGQCVGGEILSCGQGEECNPATGMCELVSSGEICSDGIDNDSDGLFDCEDPDCNDALECSAFCDDGNPCTFDFFDEQVGCVSDPFVVDGQACDDGLSCTEGDLCEAGQCVGASICSEPFTCDAASNSCACSGGPTELVCNDGIDNDCDGLVDSADSDCSVLADLAVTCSLPITRTMSSSDLNEIGSDTGGYSCGSPFVLPDQNGPDDVYSFTCQQDGPVTLFVTDMACDLDLYVLTNPNDPANTCVEGSTEGASATDSLTFDCTVGTTYYIVIEGTGFLTTLEPDACSDGDGYTLSFDVGAGSGCAEDCDNGVDDDSDGSIDCDDSSCSEDPVCIAPVCGDSVIQGPEECDDGGITFSCDADCTFATCGDGTVNDVAGESCDDGVETATCNANCTFSSCGDGVENAAAGETCDDGNTTSGDGCSSTCQTEVTPTAIRFTDMDLKDPHIFTNLPIGGCEDVTNTVPFGIFPSFNDALQTAIQTDSDGDGELDYSPMLVFRPFDASNPTGNLDVADGRCTPAGVCDLRTTLASTPYSNVPSGICLAPLTGTTTGYSIPIVGVASPPSCFVNNSFDVTLELGGILIPLTNVQVAANYGITPTDFTNGLLRGFLSEAVADATLIPSSVPQVGGAPLSFVLPGGTSNCHSEDDRDDLDGDGTLDGWWFYFNYDGTQATYIGP